MDPFMIVWLLAIVSIWIGGGFVSMLGVEWLIRRKMSVFESASVIILTVPTIGIAFFAALVLLAYANGVHINL